VCVYLQELYVQACIGTILELIRVCSRSLLDCPRPFASLHDGFQCIRCSILFNRFRKITQSKRSVCVFVCFNINNIHSCGIIMAATTKDFIELECGKG
jgi:hypothetical protein